MVETKVNLMVVGAMKAGTTAFMELLSQLPDVYASPIKEPLYFIDKPPVQLYEPSRFFSLDEYFKKDFPAQHHIAKVSRKEDYEYLFSLRKNEKYLVEGSTFYLHYPGSCQKIYDYNPNAKIIILLRDPLQRAFSHYRMDVGLGREKRSFSEVMKEQSQQYRDHTLPWFSYLGMSFYKRTVAAYEKRFSNTLVLTQSDLNVEGLEAINKLSHFLNIDFSSIEAVEKINTARSIRFPKLLFCLKRLGVKDYFSKWLGVETRQFIFKMVSKPEVDKMKLSNEILEELSAIFEEESPRY